MSLKILYGVQGTGNGHISRARKMVAHFGRRSDVEVTWLFSGRDRAALFDMAAFGDFHWRRGLTFATAAGRVSYVRTVLESAPLRFLADVRNLPLHEYDLIVSDFEPVTAWAARLQGRDVIGIGHQYAFRHAIPEAGGNPLARLIMRRFAPATLGVGLHWHHFGQPILPPIIDTALERVSSGRDYTLVYLPFEDQAAVIRLLHGIAERHFILYAPRVDDSENGNVSLRRTSLEGFRSDLCAASAVICNAGFELVSECLHVGLPVLVRPLEGQMEQASNAAALEQLGWGRALERLEAGTIREWLAAPLTPPDIRYPDVAAALVDWLCSDPESGLEAVAGRLWKSCGVAVTGQAG